MRIAQVASLLVLAFVVAACGNSSKPGAKTGGVSGTSGTASQQVTVTESEYRLQLSAMRLKAGQTTFDVINKGHIAHSLEIDGPGVSDKRISGTIAPGSSSQLTVRLQHGSYELYCPVDGHKGLGMDVHVTVGSGAATPTPAPTTTSGGNGY